MSVPDFIPPDSVLTVMAHPDDAELWAGGTLARCSAAGAVVTIAVPHHPEPRASEAAAGATALNAGLHQIERPGAAAVRELLLETRPEVVLTHPLRDVHPDHRRIAEALLEALPEVVITTGRPRRVYTVDTYNGLTLDGPIPAHTIVDVSRTWATKQGALAAHVSQPIATHFGPMAQTLARLWGARVGVTHAENFVPLPVLGRLTAANFL
ncbi:PIG-L deacetylase family protein [Streptoalloteichus hindustanus]|uniref:N-acetylglucosaminyl deacetylase, LmbE family n=1 Tax=Streptoalloteichus hindustanus TaxID=2017 RepID=A0A1M5D0H8_STRHI|nr:PIG-L family deacetylase [Streptoalloteichus hindustanus]SHF60491.1 N-acetylglucosaminyl deacetylase, LmbE family [Streptoalloteichus hindustanus]